MLKAFLVVLLCLACPDLWITVGDNCYKTSNDPMDWFDTQQYCANEGGYLAEIKDEDEQASLYGFLSSDLYYWIGLADLATDGSFVWQTNFEPVYYTNWASEQQDDSSGDEDCVHLCQDFFWNDNHCDRTSAGGDSNLPLHDLCETANVSQ